MRKILTGSALLLMCTALLAQSYLPEKNNSKIKARPKADVQAFGFSLRDVRLLEGSPFKNAMDKDAAYLLTIEPDRLLFRFYQNAGLPTKAEIYGGWEKDGLSGHTLGHYLSACAMMYASTGDVRYKQKVDYIVDELARCQLARKTGYVGAIPNEDSIFWKVQHGIIKTRGFDLNGGWSPWYTVHKVMAGLTDSYLYCDNEKALTVVLGIADWAAVILKDLNEDQLEEMRKCEYGGMNDILVHLYELTADKKYLDLSYKFHDQFILGKLAKRMDAMQGKHSNTNVPKAVGCARRYDHTVDESDRTIASFFWETLVKHYTYVIGGNSNYENLNEPDKLNDRLSDNTCETCNTYNMLKLTRFLFTWQPNTSWADYYERALYNHILASQNPEDGMMCYFVPLRMGTKKEFSTPFNTFTCCVGSGMENHTKYTEGIYYEGKDGSLMVNLFIPSELNWRDKGVVVKQESNFPEGEKIKFSVQAKQPSKFALRIRQPKWAAADMKIAVNGKETKSSKDAAGYWSLDRTWGKNDMIEVTMPMKLYTESMPDNANRIAFLYGPVVLAGQLGEKMPDPVYGTTVLITGDRTVTDWMKPVANAPVTFETVNTAKPADVTLIPFYKTFDQYYNVYWDYFTPAEWTRRQADYELEKKRQHDLEERTIDMIRLGEMQPERDHNFKASEKSYVSDAMGIMGREVRLGGFFSFEMAVKDMPSNLLCTYISDDKNSSFDLYVDDVKVGTQELTGGAGGRFFNVEYSIPDNVLKGKTKVTVRVQAHAGKTAGRVFYCRIVRK